MRTPTNPTSSEINNYTSLSDHEETRTHERIKPRYD
jgi:hypothetical protein